MSLIVEPRSHKNILNFNLNKQTSINQLNTKFDTFSKGDNPLNKKKACAKVNFGSITLLISPKAHNQIKRAKGDVQKLFKFVEGLVAQQKHSDDNILITIRQNFWKSYEFLIYPEPLALTDYANTAKTGKNFQNNLEFAIIDSVNRSTTKLKFLRDFASRNK